MRMALRPRGWKTEREAPLAQASDPSLLVQTVTSLVRSAAVKAAIEGSASGAEPRVDVEKIERGDLERPVGRRFGAPVHALLASIDLKADEISAAITTVQRVLEHPILRRAATAGNGGLRVTGHAHPRR